MKLENLIFLKQESCNLVIILGANLVEAINPNVVFWENVC